MMPSCELVANIFTGLIFISIHLLQIAGDSDSHEDSPKDVHPGHLKPFGTAGPFVSVNEVDGFPTTGEFFRNYVLPLKPLKMNGAGKYSFAFHRWTDEYFLSLTVPQDYTVSVEIGKKENRDDPVLHLNFQEFVEVYNRTDQYMVDAVPEFIRSDVTLPGPLQCEHIVKELLVENVMWMSSGGTSSVVHTDSVDNIICIFRGSKRLVLIDPSLYRDEIDLEHPDGGYSDIDVLRVDYTKYPNLSKVSYHVVQLSAGDCLYIPYKWIHQVSSYGSNIAVNVWWNHHRSKQINFDQCSNNFDQTFSLDDVIFHGFDSAMADPESFKDYFGDFVTKDMHIDEFIDMFFKEDDDRKLKVPTVAPLRHVFLKIDKNRDKIISRSELLQLSEKDWKLIEMYMNHFDMEMEGVDLPEEGRTSEEHYKSEL